MCTANKTGLGSTLEIVAISFSPKVLNNPKPAIEASFAALRKIRTESLAEVIRITSSVNETVTEIALGSLNNLVNLFRLALSYLFRLGVDSLISALALSTADEANSSIFGSVAIGLLILASIPLI